MSGERETFEQYASRISGLEFEVITPEMRVALNGQYLTAYPPGKIINIDINIIDLFRIMSCPHLLLFDKEF